MDFRALVIGQLGLIRRTGEGGGIRCCTLIRAKHSFSALLCSELRGKTEGGEGQTGMGGGVRRLETPGAGGTSVLRAQNIFLKMQRLGCSSNALLTVSCLGDLGVKRWGATGVKGGMCKAAGAPRRRAAFARGTLPTPRCSP